MIQVKLPAGVWTYDPDKPLGNPGGFGAVFLGASAAGAQVAVKRLHLNAAKAAHRELSIAKELSNREFINVLPVLDAGQDADSDGYFIVMPVAEMSLQDSIVSSGPMVEVGAAEVLRQIALGLLEVPGIVHRDLKPANILLLDGRWRVADFGIARFVEESTSAETLKDCLSPDYAAPEQWMFEHATAATDVYALGCIGYTLLTGSPPFSGTISELREQHLHAAPAELVSAGPFLRAIIGSTLRKQQQARPTLARLTDSLSRVKAAVEVVRDDDALVRLANAGAAHQKKEAEEEAVCEHARTEQAKRKALAGEARQILRDIMLKLANMVKASVPNADIRNTEASLIVGVGEATLEIDLQSSSGTLSPKAFPRSGWDVVCGAVIEVKQASPRHGRAANLWYTRQAIPKAAYRWYEVGYEGNPLSQRGFEFEPAAVAVELADRAHWTGMDVIQTSYRPLTIDDEDAESFCNRWLRILAEASAGNLARLPRGGP